MKDSLAGTVIRWISLGVVFLATIEMAVRVEQKIKWGAPLIGKYTHGHLITRDSVTIKGRPNFRYEKWGMNSFGFRGPEILEAKRPGTIRVATLGASETFGLFESEGSEYPAQLQTILDSLAPGKFEVVNVGLPGMMPSAMLPYVHTVLSRISPDIVTLYPSPSFFLENNPPVDSLVLRPMMPEPDGWRKIKSDVVSFRPRVTEKVKVVLKRVVPLTMQIRLRESRLARARAAFDGMGVWESVPEDRIAIFESQILRVIDAIRSIDAIPVLITHVNRYLHRDGVFDLDDMQHLLALQSTDWPRATDAVAIGVDSVANNRLRAIGYRERVPIIELEGRVPAGPDHFADYSHFSESGSSLVAKIIADWFFSEYITPAY